MDSFKKSVLQLRSNSKEIFEEATRLLIKIADNILKEPTNIKIRTLHKSNETISRKILNVNGGLECLKLMGFEDNSAALILPSGASIQTLQLFRTNLSKAHDELNTNIFAELVETNASSDSSSSSSSSSSKSESSCGAVPKVLMHLEETKREKSHNLIPHNVPTVNLPPINYMFTNQFVRGVELAFHMALAYNDKELQKRALSLIPQVKLETAAQNRLRIIQEQVKKGNMKDPNISIDDLLLLELLSWFKNDFFTWVNSPDCRYCNGETVFSHMSQDSMLMVHTQRVEMHQCNNCQQLTAFPRYNDVNILLITRSGRCGEWANTFTLLCCAMGWDARLVVDQGDHVWTEVYSNAQKRWLHCDPCENACDTPLIYENGWGKQLTYVIAYSAEEVQDVTWRYSSQHKVVLQRRVQCTEKELVDAMVKLRMERQKSLSSARQDYLTKRLLNELVELMIEKKPTDNDKQGRTSGSEGWRLARGEIQEEVANHCWILKKTDTTLGSVIVRYCAASDCYEYTNVNGDSISKSGWHTGVSNATDVFRKEEKDWKMVYLSRTEGAQIGSISWKFQVENESQVINAVDVRFEHKLYENGKVDVDIESEIGLIMLPTNVEEYRTTAVAGSRFLTITARLSGGRGDVAWQHAQLFRQSLASNDCPLVVTFSFKSIN